MLYALGPGKIRDVNQPVHSRFDFDECAEIGEIAYFALNPCTGSIALSQADPRVGLGLPEPERDAAILRIQLENNRFDFISSRNHLRRMPQPLAPAHLRHMDEALNSRLKLNEGAVIRYIQNLPPDPAVRLIFLFDTEPGVFGKLFEPERDSFPLRIELQH